MSVGETKNLKLSRFQNSSSSPPPPPQVRSPPLSDPNTSFLNCIQWNHYTSTCPRSSWMRARTMSVSVANGMDPHDPNRSALSFEPLFSHNWTELVLPGPSLLRVRRFLRRSTVWTVMAFSKEFYSRSALGGGTRSSSSWRYWIQVVAKVCLQSLCTYFGIVLLLLLALLWQLLSPAAIHGCFCCCDGWWIITRQRFFFCP